MYNVYVSLIYISSREWKESALVKMPVTEHWTKYGTNMEDIYFICILWNYLEK